VGRRRPADNVERLQGLILWARKERVVIREAQVGDVAISFTDAGMTADKLPAIALPGNDDPYKRWGGDLLERYTQKASKDLPADEIVYEDDD
jgi:hypothetical protein